MIPSSEALVKAAKKKITDTINEIIQMSPKADTYEALEELDEHLTEELDRVQHHMDAIEDEEDGDAE